MSKHTHAASLSCFSEPHRSHTHKYTQLFDSLCSSWTWHDYSFACQLFHAGGYSSSLPTAVVYCVSSKVLPDPTRRSVLSGFPKSRRLSSLLPRTTMLEGAAPSLFITGDINIPRCSPSHFHKTHTHTYLGECPRTDLTWCCLHLPPLRTPKWHISAACCTLKSQLWILSMLM